MRPADWRWEFQELGLEFPVELRPTKKKAAEQALPDQKEVNQRRKEFEDYLERNGPYPLSNLSQWLALDTWSPVEAILLMIDLDPDRSKVDEEPFSSRLESIELVNAWPLSDIHADWFFELPEDPDDWGQSGDSLSKHINNKRRRMTRYRDAFKAIARLWSRDPNVRPDENYEKTAYVDWAKRRQIDIPWLDWASDAGFLDVREEAESQVVSETERTTLLRLILGMAVAKYEYDPHAKRNDATGDNRGSIVDSLFQLGMRVDSDTVRKYLKEAVEKLGWPPSS